MAKEYEFICNECEGIFTTRDIGQPICRLCWQKTGLSRAILPDMWGYPTPTPKQEVRWSAGKNAKRLIRERQRAINNTFKKEKLK